MAITWEAFGQTKDGTPVTRYLLQDGQVTAGILTYGGILQSLIVPDRHGNPIDLVLGFDTPQDYENQTCYLGAIVGRHANRIADGKFTINGKEYTVACNDNGVNHLHGGQQGFDRKHWNPEVDGDRLQLSYESADGEEGYPGNLDVTVTYWLEQGALHVEYQAKSDADTVCNLTNHTYFNLAGHQSGSVAAQAIQIPAQYYTPLNANNVPTGQKVSVDGTPLDLRKPTAIGAYWDGTHPQIVQGSGYDHNYIPDGVGMREVARAACKETGIALLVKSDLPGIQFYTGNFLNDTLPSGKNGVRYGRRQGFCLETQYFPNFPVWEPVQQPILRAGNIYQHKTIFEISMEA